MKVFVILLVLIGFAGTAWAEVTLSAEPTSAKFGDDIIIHASLPSYEKPDDLRYFIDVFDREGRKVDSTLWFAREDFNYTMRTEHPAFNITRAGDYTIYVEKGFNIYRTGEIVKTTLFTIITNPSPLKQVDRGISPINVICNDELVLIQKHDGSPACVTEQTKQKLIERGWTAKDSTVSVKGCDTKADFDLVRYQMIHYIPPQRLVAFLKEGTTGFICLQYQSNLENKGFFDIDEDMYQRNSKTEISSEVTLNAKPNQVSLEYGTDIMVVYEIRASSNSTGVYWINLSQLCDSLPVVIWNDEPKVSESDIPVRTGVKHCPMNVLDVSITGYSGLDLKYHSAKPT